MPACSLLDCSVLISVWMLPWWMSFSFSSVSRPKRTCFDSSSVWAGCGWFAWAASRCVISFSKSRSRGSWLSISVFHPLHSLISSPLIQLDSVSSKVENPTFRISDRMFSSKFIKSFCPSEMAFDVFSCFSWLLDSCSFLEETALIHPSTTPKKLEGNCWK